MSDTGNQPAETPETEAEKRHDAQRELVRAYKRVFSTEDGRRVLADLERKYHWGEDPYTIGIEHGDLSFHCGVHSPIRYIHKMKNTELRPLGKKAPKALAKSGLAPKPFAS